MSQTNAHTNTQNTCASHSALGRLLSAHGIQWPNRQKSSLRHCCDLPVNSDAWLTSTWPTWSSGRVATASGLDARSRAASTVSSMLWQPGTVSMPHASAVLAAAAAPARHAQAAPEAPIAAHSPGRVRVRASTSKSLAVIIPHRERHVYCWECLTSAHLDMRGTTFACPFGLAGRSPSLIVALCFPRAHTAPAAAQPLARACRACRSLLEALWLRRSDE